MNCPTQSTPAPPPDPPPRRTALIEAAILCTLASLPLGGSLTPMELALALTRDGLSAPPGVRLPGNPAEAWRALLPEVRDAVMRLAARGAVTILRKGRPVAPAAARGVIRLRLAAPAA